MSKNVTVELIGAARVVAGRKEISLALADGATWRDVIAALARAIPGLLGEVVAKDGRSLLGDYTFYLGGRTFVRNLDGEAQPPESGRVTLMDVSDI
jgi:hypothetical protein